MRSDLLSSEPLVAPVNVTWEITGRCNLECRHCLSADLRAQGKGELTFDECLAVVDELAAAEVFQVNFGGGEPFLRDDLLGVLEYAQAKGHHHLREHERDAPDGPRSSASCSAWTISFCR